MKKIPMLDLRLEYEYMKEDIDSAIRTCLEHQKWILGPEVKELEEKIATYLKVKHCLGVSSGTDALVLSLRALAIKIKGEEYWSKDDLIITTPFTFTATGDAILRAGATPVFVDIDPKTYNIDPQKIRDYLTSNVSRVIGIIPVHLYGLSCNMDEIIEIAREYNLFVVEDAAQAFGGIYKGKKLGSMGTAGAFSFFPAKNLGCFGDGGMVSTDDDELAELIRMLLKHGGKDKYNVDHIGYNARLDTLQAAVLLAKLKCIDEFNGHRRKIAEIYNEQLKDLDEIILPITHSPSPVTDFYHVYHQYTVRILRNKRDELKEGLQKKGTSSAIYYPLPLHKMKVFHEKCKLVSHLIEAEKAVKEVLSLPMGPFLKEEEISSVCKTIKEAIC